MLKWQDKIYKKTSKAMLYNKGSGNIEIKLLDCDALLPWCFIKNFLSTVSFKVLLACMVSAHVHTFNREIIRLTMWNVAFFPVWSVLYPCYCVLNKFFSACFDCVAQFLITWTPLRWIDEVVHGVISWLSICDLLSMTSLNKR